MRSRLATVLTTVALVGGTGGAIAIGASGSNGGSQGGAACGQYNPGHQKNGKPCPKPKGAPLKGTSKTKHGK